MSFFQNSADQRTAEYNRYFRIMSEGLVARDAVEFHDEMQQIALHAIDPALRRKAEQEMNRYGECIIQTAANGR